MKVLQICPSYFGTQLYQNLFLALESIGIISEVFVCNNNRILDKNEKPYNVKALDEGFNKLDRFLYFGKQRTIYKKICQEYSISEFKLVHAHTLFSAGYASYLLHKNFGIPFIVTIREADLLFFKYMFHLRSLGIKILKNAQNIIFISPSYRDLIIEKYISKKIRKNFLDKSYVIPNGIDNYFLDNKFGANQSFNLNFIKLIYIGNVIRRKNIETSIKACKLLINMGYTVNYTIVGEIIDPKYHKIISKYKFINYYPKCTKEEVITHLRNSDVFLMPSILETFGLVYPEAMSQGRPVIYSRGQGFDGQFENGIVGYAVNCFDYTDISYKIIDIYDHYQQFSKRCVTLVDKFNYSRIAREFLNIYQKE